MIVVKFEVSRSFIWSSDGYALVGHPLSMVSQIKLHGPFEQHKPFWVPRGDTLQKAYLEEWEQVDDDQGYIRGEESKNRHRSCSIPRTTTSESLHTVKDDVWSATRELPAPRGCTYLPQSSWEPFRGSVFPPLCIVLHCMSHDTCSYVS